MHDDARFIRRFGRFRGPRLPIWVQGLAVPAGNRLQCNHLQFGLFPVLEQPGLRFLRDLPGEASRFPAPGHSGPKARRHFPAILAARVPAQRRANGEALCKHG